MGDIEPKENLEEKLWGNLDAGKKNASMERSNAKLRKFAEKAVPGKTYTLHEIAKAMGVTRERVRQIEARALKKLYRRLGQLFRYENITPSEAMDVVRQVSRGGMEHGVVEKEKEE